MKISIGLFLLTATGFLFSCKKNSDNTPTRTFSRDMLLSSVYFYNDTGKVLECDTISYDANGYLSKLVHYIYYDPRFSDVESDSTFYTFQIDPKDSLLTSYTVKTSYGFGMMNGGFNFQYDGQHRLIKEVPTNSNLYPVQFLYFSNGLDFVNSPATGPDSVFLEGGNVARWVTSVGSNPFNCQFYYSPYPNPYHASYMENFGGFFWAASFPERGDQTAHFFDGLSRNLLDSMRFSGGILEWGTYRYKWTVDGKGRVTGGDASLADSSLGTGVPYYSYSTGSYVFHYAE